MSTARRWSALQVGAAWGGAVVGLALLRWALAAGVQKTVLEEGVVRRVSGAWSEAFAAWGWRAAALVTLLWLGWVTGSWIVGRKARASMRAAEAAAHRDVLI